MDKQTELAIHLLAGTAIKLKNGQASARKEPAQWYRRMTVDEIKALSSGEWIMLPAILKGYCAPHRVTSVHTWKRDPDRWELRCVYGLKRFCTIDPNVHSEDQYPVVPLEP